MSRTVTKGHPQPPKSRLRNGVGSKARFGPARLRRAPGSMFANMAQAGVLYRKTTRTAVLDLSLFPSQFDHRRRICSLPAAIFLHHRTARMVIAACRQPRKEVFAGVSEREKSSSRSTSQLDYGKIAAAGSGVTKRSAADDAVAGDAVVEPRRVDRQKEPSGTGADQWRWVIAVVTLASIPHQCPDVRCLRRVTPTGRSPQQHLRRTSRSGRPQHALRASESYEPRWWVSRQLTAARP